MDDIAILLPCYNEEQTIGKVVGDWRRVLPDAAVYVYDNASTDGTARIAGDAGAVVRREPCRGKGNVVRRMLREIDARCYILVDGDDTYPAEDGPEMAREILEGSADMVVGDRLSSTYLQENRRRFHGLGNIFICRVIDRIFRSDVNDVMSGLRAFSFPFAKTFPVLSHGFEIETEMTIHAIDKGLCIREIPVRYRNRPSGSESKLRTIPDGIRVLKTILTLYKDYRPMQFFGTLSLALLSIAVISFLPILSSYLRTGLVARFPTLIVIGSTAVIAVLCFFAGLILDTFIQKDRRDFEFRFWLAYKEGPPPPRTRVLSPTMVRSKDEEAQT